VSLLPRAILGSFSDSEERWCLRSWRPRTGQRRRRRRRGERGLHAAAAAPTPPVGEGPVQRVVGAAEQPGVPGRGVPARLPDELGVLNYMSLIETFEGEQIQKRE
jgi:hypothetical protein